MKKGFVVVVAVVALGAMVAEMAAAALRTVAGGLEFPGQAALSVVDDDGR